MRKSISFFVILLLVFSSLVADAQKRKKDTLNLCRPGSYVLADLGGGLHTMSYKLNNLGHKASGAGFNGRVGYRFFFNENWGAGVDLNIKSYMSSGKFNYINYIPGAIDQDGETYQHRTYYTYLKERQNEMTFGVPFGVYYQQRLKRKYKIGGGLGFIPQFMISDKFKTTDGYLQTRSFYEKYHLELDNMEQHYLYNSSDFSGKNSLKTSYGAFGEFDFMYVLNWRLDLNLSLYTTYGINNVKEDSDKPQYDPDCMSVAAYKNPTYNGLFNSNVIEKVNPFSIGVMVGLRYRLIHTPKEKPVKVKEDKTKKNDKPVENPDDQILIADNPNDKKDDKPVDQPSDDKPNDDPIVADNKPEDNPVVEENKPIDDPIVADNKPEDNPVVEENKPTDDPIVADNKPEDNPVIEENKPTDDPIVADNKPEDNPVVEENKPTDDPIVADNKPEDEPQGNIQIEINNLEFVAVNFDYAKSNIKSPNSTATMFDEIAKLVNNHKELKITIIGHTDNSGSLALNKALGLKRAQSAKAELVKRGVAANRITCESRAYNEPLVPNDSPENMAKNRRVEIKIY